MCTHLDVKKELIGCPEPSSLEVFGIFIQDFLYEVAAQSFRLFSTLIKSGK